MTPIREDKDSAVKRLAALAGMASLLVSIAACGSSNNGGTPTTTAGASSATSSPTTTTSTTSASLATTDPCSLLPASAATNLGYPAQGKSQTSGGQPDCVWAGTLGVADALILTKLGLSQLQPSGGTLTDVTVGSHQAKQLDEGGGACVISLGVTLTSRVDVQLVANNNSQACPGVLALAKAVEPNLPSS